MVEELRWCYIEGIFQMLEKCSICFSECISCLSNIFIDEGQFDLFNSLMVSITDVGKTENLLKVLSYLIILMTHIIMSQLLEEGR